MMDDETRHRTTISDIIHFYKQQIARFESIGIGNQTEFNTTVTEQLMSITRRRLGELLHKKFTNSSRSNNGVK